MKTVNQILERIEQRTRWSIANIQQHAGGDDDSTDCVNKTLIDAGYIAALAEMREWIEGGDAGEREESIDVEAAKLGIEKVGKLIGKCMASDCRAEDLVELGFALGETRAAIGLPSHSDFYDSVKQKANGRKEIVFSPPSALFPNAESMNRAEKQVAESIKKIADNLDGVNL